MSFSPRLALFSAILAALWASACGGDVVVDAAASTTGGSGGAATTSACVDSPGSCTDGADCCSTVCSAMGTCEPICDIDGCHD